MMQYEFRDKSLPELLEVILNVTSGNRQNVAEGDEAMWYVLHERLDEALSLKFNDYEEGLWDSFEDLRDDFFLYLREGNVRCVKKPYTALQRIKNRESFEKWVISTWRNFLSGRVEKEEASKQVCYVRACDAPDPTTIIKENGVGDFKFASLSDEQKIQIVSQLIAYCNQVFLPRGRFIFLRTIMTLLNKKQALPEKDMAEALGMTDINYRVTNYRLKYNVKRFLESLLKGEKLRLNDHHQNIAKKIDDDFYNLYSVLMECYNDVLQTLKQRDKIMSLRLSKIQPDGTMLHEDEWKEYQMDIRSFWNRLEKELNR